MNHEDKLFNAAVTIYAHKDISIDQAMRFAERLWEKSVETAIAYETMKDCTCPACCQKEMYVSDVEDNKAYDALADDSTDEDGLTLDERAQRGYPYPSAI